jgi:tryptophan synthase beta chain
VNPDVIEKRTGYFGVYGGRFVPETLIPALEELDQAFSTLRHDPAFQSELAGVLRDFGGRPTPLMLAESLSRRAGGARIFLKREDLLHTGAHKLNNTLGQCLLAKRMGKPRVIAETGAGQHGVATAAACAKLGLACEVFMGAVDVERQAPNVQRMKLLGARVHPVLSGSQTLKDAMNEALRDWVTNVRTTFYCLGSVAGPHPYPTLVRDLQRVIGDEARREILEREGRLPDALVACVGGGSNAMGIFTAFLADRDVALWAVEAAGEGLASGRHGASLTRGRPAVLHGSRSSVLQDDDGQIAEAHSISAGLDYPGVGPELAALRDAKRLSIASATDHEALRAFAELCRDEGILPALESSHALARAVDIARDLGPAGLVIVNLSGRGDKDLTQAIHGLSRLDAEAT